MGEERTNFVFASEIDQQTLAVLQANHGIQDVARDVRSRDNSKMKSVDVYTWGAPCTSYAPGGKCEGDTTEKGQLIFSGLAYVRAKLPRVFVCEGSHTLTGVHSGVLEKLINEANEIRDSNGASVYHVDFKTMRSKAHAVPQDRVRTYLVGWQKKFSRRISKFDWPDGFPIPAVANFVCPGLPSKLPTDKVAVDNLSRILPKMANDVVNLRLVNGFVDAYQSASFGDHWSVDVCPTITRARAGVGGFFMTKEWRMMSDVELANFQGFPKDRLRWSDLVTEKNRPVTRRQFQMMLGNAFTVPVIGRILWKALMLTKKLDKSTPDPWKL